jgi:hypothetical protein
MATVTEIEIVPHPYEDRGSVARGSRGFKGTFVINAKGRGQKVFVASSEAGVRAAAVTYGESLG